MIQKQKQLRVYFCVLEDAEGSMSGLDGLFRVGRRGPSRP